MALKVLRDDLGLPPELKAQLVERMRQEARAAATLSHPAMVTLHDMGEDERGGALPRLRAHRRARRCASGCSEGGPLPPARSRGIARALGSALTHAHEAGVVHRDVKPENVMLSPVGPKLTDFGIARLPDSTLTRATTRPRHARVQRARGARVGRLQRARATSSRSPRRSTRR